MKFFTSFLTVLLLPLTAFAGNLPGILQVKLRLKMAAADYQLALAEAPHSLKDKDFKAKSEAALEAYGKDPLLAGAMDLSSVGPGKAIESAAGGSGTLVSIMHAPSRHGKDLFPLFGPAFLIFSADAFEIYSTKVKGGNEEYLVNENKANGLSMMAAKEISSLASLPPGAEAAIKEALMKAIQEKVKAGDKTAIDPYKLLAAVSARNRETIPARALAPFAGAEKAAASWANRSDQEMIRDVLAAGSLLKTSVATGKIKAEAERAEKLVAEIEYMANQAAAYRGPDKPASGATAP